MGIVCTPRAILVCLDIGGSLGKVIGRSRDRARGAIGDFPSVDGRTQERRLRRCRRMPACFPGGVVSCCTPVLGCGSSWGPLWVLVDSCDDAFCSFLCWVSCSCPCHGEFRGVASCFDGFGSRLDFYCDSFFFACLCSFFCVCPVFLPPSLSWNTAQLGLG